MSMYSSPSGAFKAGQEARRNKLKRWESPISKRTHANLYQLWLDGWDKECTPHKGDPCQKCGVPHDEVKSGKCNPNNQQ